MRCQSGTVYIKQVTATADTPFQVEEQGSEEGQTILTSVNIHCYTNDCYMGNAAFQQAIIRANAVVWFDGMIRVSDFYFKNVTGGSNTVVVITGIVK